MTVATKKSIHQIYGTVLCLFLACSCAGNTNMPSSSSAPTSDLVIKKTKPVPLSGAGYLPSTQPSYEYHWSLIEGAVAYEFQQMDETNTIVYYNQKGIQSPPFKIPGAVF